MSNESGRTPFADADYKMATENQKLPIVVKALIGLVILLFVLPILAIAPALLSAIKKGPSVANQLSEWEGNPRLISRLRQPMVQ